jgi:hypothetical protein
MFPATVVVLKSSQDPSTSVGMTGAMKGDRPRRQGEKSRVARREISLCAGRPFTGVKGKKKSACSVRNDVRGEGRLCRS